MRKLLLAGVILSAAAVSADVIKFKSGDRLTGSLKSINATEAVFESKVAGKVTVKLADIETLSSDTESVIQYQDYTKEKGFVGVNKKGDVTVNDGKPSAKKVKAADIKALNPEESAWHGSVNASFTARRGNTRGSDFAVIGGANRRWEYDRLTGDFGYYRTKTGTTRLDEKKTQDRLFAQAQHDHFWWKNKFYTYEKGRYDHDRIANLEWRYTLGLGLGYQWLEKVDLLGTGEWSFNQELGFSYVHERYRKTDHHENDYAAVRYAHHLNYLPSWVSHLKMFHNLEYQPSLDDSEVWLMNADIGAAVELSAAWQLLAKIEWDYNNQPSDNRKSSDIRYILGLGYTF